MRSRTWPSIGSEVPSKPWPPAAPARIAAVARKVSIASDRRRRFELVVQLRAMNHVHPTALSTAREGRESAAWFAYYWRFS
jgi:hypothetical protein